jgi:hypothetical protein
LRAQQCQHDLVDSFCQQSAAQENTSEIVMDEAKALSIVSALANGINPLTGEVLAPDSPYQSSPIVRALYVAIRALEQSTRRRTRPRTGMPDNAGKLWSEEEDRRLLVAFDEGRSAGELAQAHGRTQAGIQARLEKFGRLQLRPEARPSWNARVP